MLKLQNTQEHFLIAIKLCLNAITNTQHAFDIKELYLIIIKVLHTMDVNCFVVNNFNFLHDLTTSNGTVGVIGGS